MRRLTYAVLITALALFPARADPIRWSEPRLLAPDTVAFLRQYSQAIAARDTVLWTVWAENRGNGQHVLWASRFNNGSWLEPESVAGEPDYIESVKAAVDAELNPWVAWDDCKWSRRQGGSWSPPEHIAKDSSIWGAVSDLTASAEHGVWALWSGVDPDAESVFIYTSRYYAGSWTEPCLVAKFDWYLLMYGEGLTAPPGGPVRSVWTGWLETGFGIYSSTWGGDSWVNREMIPESWLGGPLAVCSDSVGGTWVTWLQGWMGDSLYVLCARHDRTAWTDTWRLTAGLAVHVYQGMLCCDDHGRIWALWGDRRYALPDTVDICVRYFDGDTWSGRVVVTTCPRMEAAPQAAAALGKVWVVWTARESQDRWLLYYSHTLPSGVAEERSPKPAAVSPLRVFPSPARYWVWLEGADKAALFTPDGRRAASLTRGRNDIRSLPRGVYLVRAADADSPVSKVVLSR
uniref:T9SS type A sorting domain-containing protein n=1 Tax=candidate division WOR-3 bacterium TaxID=2052148 RepID=A0A7C4CC77_UNCW3